DDFLGRRRIRDRGCKAAQQGHREQPPNVSQQKHDSLQPVSNGASSGQARGIRDGDLGLILLWKVAAGWILRQSLSCSRVAPRCNGTHLVLGDNELVLASGPMPYI